MSDIINTSHEIFKFMTIIKFFRDATDQLEMFAYPIFLKAEKTLKNNQVDEFIKRWPTWSKRLRYFPELQDQLCQAVLDCFKKDLGQIQLLETFFDTTRFPIKSSHSSVADLYKLAILKDEWDFVNKSFPFVQSQFDKENSTVLAALMSVSFSKTKHVDKGLYKVFLEKSLLDWTGDIQEVEQKTAFKFDKWIENSMNHFIGGNNYSNTNYSSKAINMASCLSFYHAKDLYSGVILYGPEETLSIAIEKAPSFVNAFDHLMQRKVQTSPDLLAKFLMDENFKDVAEIHRFTSIQKMRVYFETKKDHYAQACEDFLKAVDIVEAYEMQKKLDQIVNTISNDSIVKKRKI